MAKKFASQGDMTEKKISFSEVGRDIWAFTAEGDPNTGVVIGDDSVLIVDTQATPLMADKVIEKIRSVTDKPIKYVVLSHYHAVRVLGASAYIEASEIISSSLCNAMIHERGAEDWQSEFTRFPRLFRGHETIPSLTFPTLTFDKKMTLYLGKRRVDLLHLGRAHTAGDIVAWVPDERVMLSGDIVEYRSACYCGDGHFHDWRNTLKAIAEFSPLSLVPGRGDALKGEAKVQEAIASTDDFLISTYQPAAQIAAGGGNLQEAFAAVRASCDKKFKDYAIYEHCLPFNVARAYDEALGMDTPRIWTEERDAQMWQALQS